MEDPEIAEAVKQVILEGKVDATAGDGLVRSLEQAWEEMMGGGYALALCNGTAGLFSALLAAGVRPRDEVICPPLAPPYALAPVLHCGATPVFADIHPRTLTVDPAAALALVSPRTRVILAVDLFGHPADVEPLVREAHARGIIVIEDCAQAQGATYLGRPAGAAADIAVFSLHATKNLPAGEGGMLWTRRRDLYERAMLVGMHPARLDRDLTIPELRRYLDTGLGYNLRPHPLGVVMALAELQHFPDRLARRQANARYLDDQIAHIRGLEPTYVAPGCTHAYNLHPVFYRGSETGAGSLEEYVTRVRTAGVDADVLWPLAYDLPLFQERGFPPPRCPVAEEVEDSVLLFGWGGFVRASREDLDHAVQALSDAMQPHGSDVTANGTL